MSERQRYPSNLSEARWTLVETLLTIWQGDKARHGLNVGTPPQHDLRVLLDAILYIARTGIPWRYLSHDYPHWNTTYGHFAGENATASSSVSTPCCGARSARRKAATVNRQPS